MLTLGKIIIVVGLLALVGAVLKRMRAGRIARTPFAAPSAIAQNGRALADAKGSISTEGMVQHGHLLTSPVTGTPCLFFDFKLEAKWKDGQTEIAKVLMDAQEAVPFAIMDGAGRVGVTLDPKSSLEYDVTTPMKAKKFSRGLMATLTSAPIEVTPRFSIPVGLTYPAPLGRQLPVPPTAKFYITERFLEPKPFFHVNGRLLEDGTIGKPSWTALLVKEQRRDVLLAESTSAAKKLFLAGGIGSGLGALFLVLGFFVFPPEPEATAAAKLPAPVTVTNASAAPTATPTPVADPTPPAPVVAKGAKPAASAVKPTASSSAAPTGSAKAKPAPTVSAKSK